MKEISVKPINLTNSFRKVCASFSLPRKEFPIKGGWGLLRKMLLLTKKTSNT